MFCLLILQHSDLNATDNKIFVFLYEYYTNNQYKSCLGPIHDVMLLLLRSTLSFQERLITMPSSWPYNQNIEQVQHVGPYGQHRPDAHSCVQYFDMFSSDDSGEFHKNDKVVVENKQETRRRKKRAGGCKDISSSNSTVLSNYSLTKGVPTKEGNKDRTVIQGKEGKGGKQVNKENDNLPDEYDPFVKAIQEGGRRTKQGRTT